MCVCVCIYIHTYIHTQLHTHTIYMCMCERECLHDVETKAKTIWHSNYRELQLLSNLILSMHDKVRTVAKGCHHQLKSQSSANPTSLRKRQLYTPDITNITSPLLYIYLEETLFLYYIYAFGRDYIYIYIYIYKRELCVCVNCSRGHGYYRKINVILNLRTKSIRYCLY